MPPRNTRPQTRSGGSNVPPSSSNEPSGWSKARAATPRVGAFDFLDHIPSPVIEGKRDEPANNAMAAEPSGSVIARTPSVERSTYDFLLHIPSPVIARSNDDIMGPPIETSRSPSACSTSAARTGLPPVQTQQGGPVRGQSVTACPVSRQSQGNVQGPATGISIRTRQSPYDFLQYINASQDVTCERANVAAAPVQRMDIDEGAREDEDGRSDPESEEGIPHIEPISMPTNEIRSAGIVALRPTPAPSIQSLPSSSSSIIQPRRSPMSTTPGPPTMEGTFDHDVPIHMPPINIGGADTHNTLDIFTNVLNTIAGDLTRTREELFRINDDILRAVVVINFLITALQRRT